MAIDERKICSLNRVIGELLGEALMRRIRFRHHQQARCVFVDPVDDTRARYASDTGQRAITMVQQRIDQRAIGIARRRMNDHSGGLVDDDQVLILIHHHYGDILWVSLWIT